MDEKQKIIDALKTIKAVCENIGCNCEKCPLYDSSYDCGVMNLTPCDWKIEPDEVWRVLM